MNRAKKICIAYGATAALMLLIFFFSAQPAKLSGAVSTRLGTIILDVLSALSGALHIKTFIPASAADIDFWVRKFAHFLLYFSLGASLFCSMRATFYRKWLPALSASAIGILYAVSDEIHQAFVPGRACMLADMLLDSIAVLLAVWLLRFILPKQSEN